MGITFTLEFKDITEDGLPLIDENNTCVIFLWDGNIISGWPIFGDTYLPGQPMPLKELVNIAWAGNDFIHEKSTTGMVAGVRYWAYVPETLWRLSLPDIETTWMYQEGFLGDTP